MGDENAEQPQLQLQKRRGQHVLLSTWVTKQGYFKKNWRKRWCVLDTRTIKYFESDKNKKPKKTIDLSKVLHVNVATQSEEGTNTGSSTELAAQLKHGLLVSVRGTLSNRVFKFGFESDKERDEWKVWITLAYSALQPPQVTGSMQLESGQATITAKNLESGSCARLDHCKAYLQSNKSYVVNVEIDVEPNSADADPCLFTPEWIAGFMASIAKVVNESSLYDLSQASGKELDAENEIGSATKAVMKELLNPLYMRTSGSICVVTLLVPFNVEKLGTTQIWDVAGSTDGGAMKSCSVLDFYLDAMAPTQKLYAETTNGRVGFASSKTLVFVTPDRHFNIAPTKRGGAIVATSWNKLLDKFE